MYSVLNTISEYTLLHMAYSISNHPEYWNIDTLTSLICLKFLPVVDIIKTRKSWKYELLTPNGSEIMSFFRFYLNHVSQVKSAILNSHLLAYF